GATWQTSSEHLNTLEVLHGELLNRVGAEIYAKQGFDPTPAEGAMLTYYETTSGRRALKGWSHFPTNYTEQFVYSTEQAAEISKTTKETVLSMPSVAAPVKASETADRVAPAAPAPNQPAVAVTEA